MANVDIFWDKEHEGSGQDQGTVARPYRINRAKPGRQRDKDWPGISREALNRRNRIVSPLRKQGSDPQTGCLHSGQGMSAKLANRSDPDRSAAGAPKDVGTCF